MRRISLHHLETLLWISRLGTFAAAAERLNATQPAVSARIRELEYQLGYQLFQRAGRGMALTVRGRRFVTECETLWGSIEQTLLQPDHLGGSSGTVRIGSGEIAAATCLPPFLTVLGRDLPKVNFEVEIDLSHGLLQKLLGANSDLIFLAGPVASANLEVTAIGSVELIWAARPDIAEQARRDPSSASIWVLHRHSPIHRVAMDSLAEVGLSQQRINSCNNARALIDIVAAEGGVGFLPSVMVGEHLRNGSLVPLRPGVSRTITFHAAIRAQERDPLVREIFRRAAELNISPDKA